LTVLPAKYWVFEMPIRLLLRVADGVCRVTLAEGPSTLVVEMPLAELPPVEVLRADPLRQGRVLYAALGGDALRARLDASDDQLLLLECDDQTAAIPWEYAASDAALLACDYRVLRVVPRRSLPMNPRPPRLLALCADPLEPPPPYRLNFGAEMRALAAALQASGRAITARRVAPVQEKLFDALADGPALLHLSCHGTTVAVKDDAGGFTDAALLLEDARGRSRTLMGRDLLRRTPRGALRLAVLSACQTAPLARALAQGGVPAALGMQHNLPDPQSHELAAQFYRFLVAGSDLAEAVRQARGTVFDEDAGAAGMLVAYVCEDAWGALEFSEGMPNVLLGPPGDIRLPSNLVPPAHVLGRDAELGALAALYDQGVPAVTVAGTGGMGKTTLAGAFVQRFGWRFRRVLGHSFATSPVDLVDVCRSLMDRMGRSEATDGQERSAEQWRELVLRAVQADDLVVFDNYESVLAPAVRDAQTQADAIQRLLRGLVERGVPLLLTSRERPAGLPGEQLYPPDGSLDGLKPHPAAELFRTLSSRARDTEADTAERRRALELQHRRVAREAARLTEGHPLALALLAGAYDAEDADADAFLAAWPAMLERARGRGLAPYHVTFAAAVARSLATLDMEQIERLLALRAFDFPFFAEAAVFLWDLSRDLTDISVDTKRVAIKQELMPDTVLVENKFAQANKRSRTDGSRGQARRLTEITPDQDELITKANTSPDTISAVTANDSVWIARRNLALLARRNLIEGLFAETDSPATYRLHPVVRAELCRLAGDDGKAQPGYAAYGAWLARRAYGEINKSAPLAQLVQQSFDVLDAATNTLVGYERLSHIRRVAWLRVQFGDLNTALNELRDALNDAPTDSSVWSSLAFELANVLVTRGELEQAISLYEQVLAAQEALGDLQGKSVTLHQMANVLVTRGELDRAMALYEQALAAQEALGDVRGKSATLHAMANVLVTWGDLASAMALYEQVLTAQEALGDLQGKSVTLHQTANVLVTRGELDRAMALYEQALAAQEALGDVRGKSATLHAMANVLARRGELDRAMALYEQALAVQEALGDVRGKSATLHAMANVLVTRGDLAGAMQLYEQSLAWKEALGDLRGELVTIANMASLFAQQGEVKRAQQYYQRSLAMSEQLGDPWSRANVLLMLAQLQLRSGDRTAALENARTSQELFERLGATREVQDAREFIAQAEDRSHHNPTDSLRRQLIEYMPRALASDDQEARNRFIAQLEGIAEQAAEGESPGSRWRALAALLRAAAALLRGEPYEREGLLPEDAALLEQWTRGAEEGKVADGDAGEAISLADAISIWAEGAHTDDDARHESLLELLNYCAAATIDVLREGDTETREVLAEALIPLRAGLQRWPAAAQLPPYNAFLGCLQALLRGEEAQLTPLFAQLDEGLAAALERIAEAVAEARSEERGENQGTRTENQELEAETQTLDASPSDVTATDGVQHADLQSAIDLPPDIESALQRGDLQGVERGLVALPEERREVVLAALRRHSEQTMAAIPFEEQRRLALWLRQEQIRRAADEAVAAAAEVLRDGDPDARRRLAIEMGQLVVHYAQDEERGSPYDELASFLRAVAAVLRGTPMPPVPSVFVAHIIQLRTGLERRSAILLANIIQDTMPVMGLHPETSITSQLSNLYEEVVASISHCSVEGKKEALLALHKYLGQAETKIAWDGNLYSPILDLLAFTKACQKFISDTIFNYELLTNGIDHIRSNINKWTGYYKIDCIDTIAGGEVGNNNWREAIKYYEYALSLATEGKEDHNQELSRLLARVRYCLAICYTRSGKLTDAIIRHRENIDLFRSLGDYIGKANTFLELGQIYQMMNNYDLSLLYYEEAYHAFDRARSQAPLDQKKDLQKRMAHAKELLGILEFRIQLLQRSSNDLQIAASVYNELHMTEKARELHQILEQIPVNTGEQS
jgi:tetratricopeptide (TPR) repeat protein